MREKLRENGWKILLFIKFEFFIFSLIQTNGEKKFKFSFFSLTFPKAMFGTCERKEKMRENN